jgi:hypothetical protein
MSANRIKPVNDFQNRDPFASLMKNVSAKLLPLSPKVKLPKLSVALPPRPSFQGRKTENLMKVVSNEEQKSILNSPSEFPFQRKVKGKRIKLKGSFSNCESGERKIKKKRNSVVVLETENDVTFGLVGKIITKDRFD